MRILGYNTYHIYECCAVRGLPHMKIFNEAVTASFNRLSGIKRYTTSDFERWVGDYDVSGPFLERQIALTPTVSGRSAQLRRDRPDRSLYKGSQCEIHSHGEKA